MDFDADELWADVVKWSLAAFLVTVFLLVILLFLTA